jgi:hypothetical protein
MLNLTVVTTGETLPDIIENLRKVMRGINTGNTSEVEEGDDKYVLRYNLYDYNPTIEEDKVA